MSSHSGGKIEWAFNRCVCCLAGGTTTGTKEAFEVDFVDDIRQILEKSIKPMAIAKSNISMRMCENFAPADAL